MQKSDKIESSKTLAEKDYPLYEALNILKSMSFARSMQSIQ